MIPEDERKARHGPPKSVSKAGKTRRNKLVRNDSAACLGAVAMQLALQWRLPLCILSNPRFLDACRLFRTIPQQMPQQIVMNRSVALLSSKINTLPNFVCSRPVSPIECQNPFSIRHGRRGVKTREWTPGVNSGFQSRSSAAKPDLGPPNRGRYILWSISAPAFSPWHE
jgi:hypothetical protein